MDKQVVGLRAFGVYEPSLVVSVAEVKGKEGLTEEIINDLGIKEVRVAGENEHPCEMAVAAAQNALQAADLTPNDINVVIYTNTFLSEYNLWADYAYIQNQLKIKNAYSLKLCQACNSQLLAMDYAKAKLLSDETVQNVLIISSERWDEHYINRFTSAASCFYGDGASAVIMTKGTKENHLLGLEFFTDGSYSDLHYIPMGGTKIKIDAHGLKNRLYRFEPRETCKKHLQTETAREEFWRKIVGKNGELMERLLLKNNLRKTDLNFFVMYNMSKKVAEEICRLFDKSIDQSSFYLSEKYGHIGSTDICFNLAKVIQDQKVKKGDYVGLISVGFGFSWGVGLIRI